MGFEFDSDDVTMSADYYQKLLEAADLLKLARARIIELEAERNSLIQYINHKPTKGNDMPTRSKRGGKKKK